MSFNVRGDVVPRAATKAGRLFAFDAIAVIGATPRNRDAVNVLAGLEAVGYAGRVACINPKGEELRGQPGFATLAEVPFPLQAAAIVVRADRVPGVLEECAAVGIRGVTIVATHFAETGPAGRVLQDEVAAIAARHDIAVCGPNCLGFLSLHDRTSTYCAGRPPTEAGSVAVVSHSGGMLNEVMSYGSYRGVRFSKAISSGNEAVLSTADYLDDLVGDPHTTTIGLIMEGVRAPDRLRGAFAAAAARRKPIVVLKMGTSALASASAVTHTGAIAGSADIFAAMAEQHGVTLVEDIVELVEALLTFSNARALIEQRAERKGFAAIEISGGGKGLICDLADRYGLDLRPLGESAVAHMTGILGEDSSPGNPFDLQGSWETEKSLELHEAALACLAGEHAYDVVVSRITVRPTGPIPAVLAHAALINRLRAAHPETMFTVLGRSTDAINPEWQQLCAETRLTYLQGYRGGMATLGRLQRYRDFLAAGAGETPDGPRFDIATGAGLLDEVAAKELVARAGLPVNRTAFAADADTAALLAASIGLPAVVKGISPAATHKSDLGLVALGLHSVEEVRTAARDIIAQLPPSQAGRVGLSVQQMVEPGLEAIVGGYRDTLYGAVVLCALGGTFAEAFDERILWLAPVDAAACERALRRSKIGKLAQGFRRLPPADVAVLAALVSRVSAWLASTDQIVELDLNPVILRGSSATIVDARVVLR